MNKISKPLAGIGFLLFILGILGFVIRMIDSRTENSDVKSFCPIAESILGVHSEVFQSTIEVSESILQPGDPVTVFAKIRNISSETVGIEPQPLLEPLDIIQEPLATQFTLQPDEEIRIEWVLKFNDTRDIPFILNVDFWKDGTKKPYGSCRIGEIEIIVVSTLWLTVIELLARAPFYFLVIGLLLALFFTPHSLKNKVGINLLDSGMIAFVLALIPVSVFFIRWFNRKSVVEPLVLFIFAIPAIVALALGIRDVSRNGRNVLNILGMILAALEIGFVLFVVFYFLFLMA